MHDNPGCCNVATEDRVWTFQPQTWEWVALTIRITFSGHKDVRVSAKRLKLRKQTLVRSWHYPSWVWLGWEDIYAVKVLNYLWDCSKKHKNNSWCCQIKVHEEQRSRTTVLWRARTFDRGIQNVTWKRLNWVLDYNSLKKLLNSSGEIMLFPIGLF